ncbi:4-(cytidine 5'-diphospho)-2-C-methyl-D-erythritol kinase [Bacillota bacterium]
MNEIKLKAYAKINLSIDVTGKRSDGYHYVKMIMQQIKLHDEIGLKYVEKDAGGLIGITSDLEELPKDSSNIAWKAAVLMRERFPDKAKGNIFIHIKKNIPMAAGLAGGSADAAAVLHGLNTLWECGLTVSELMNLGLRLGADVPFCIMGQTAANAAAAEFPCLITPSGESVSTCALAEGIGEILTPLKPLEAFVILCKPDISVVTAEIYKSLVLEDISKRPDTAAIISGLQHGDFHAVTSAMYNVLEEVSARKYPIIREEILRLREAADGEMAMMSGSGPTVFALISRESRARDIFNKHSMCKNRFLCETSIPLS